VKDEFIVSTIETIKRTLKTVTNCSLNIQLYSEGSRNGFRAFENVTNGINGDKDQLYTFHALVTADILVPGFSSFSYAAALYNPNIVLHLNISRVADNYPLPPSFVWIRNDSVGELISTPRHLFHLQRVLSSKARTISLDYINQSHVLKL
jgi:hypothetical protein